MHNSSKIDVSLQILRLNILNSQNLKCEFKLTDVQSEQVLFFAPYSVSWIVIRTFQGKVLCYILTAIQNYINSVSRQTIDAPSANLNQKRKNIFSIARTQNDFEKTLNSIFSYWKNEFICTPLQDVLIGIITSSCPLLNYLLLITKIYIWNCLKDSYFTEYK